MSESKSKTYDFVETMRQIRDRLGREIEDLTHEELSQWLGSHQYRQPLLQRWAEIAAQRAAAEARPLPRR